MNYNRIMLAGNLTRDWELRATKGGAEVAKGAIAVNRRTKAGEETCFVDLVAFGQQAQLLHTHTGKGRPLLLEGRLSLSQWEGKDGTRRSKHEVIVENFQFVRAEEGYREAVQVEQESRRAPTPDAHDDIPF